MARILVSGCAGFLGSHLAERLVQLGHDVRGIDSLIGGEVANVPDAVHWEEADCCSPPPSAFSGVDIVYHTAASPHEGLSVFSPTIVTKNTYLSTVAMATAAINAGVKRFVFLSSMARYGYHHDLPFTEKTPCRPVDPYGIAKVAAEQVLTVLGREHNMEVVIAVPHNVIGVRQRVDPFRNVAMIFINMMLAGRVPFVYGDGRQKRCFSAVADCVAPLVEMGFKEGVDAEVFNIGPDDMPISILTLGQVIADLIGCEWKPQFLPARPCEVHAAWPSSNKARRLLGYETKTRLDEVLYEMIEWQRQRGPQAFQYSLPVEIQTKRTPRTWSERLF